MLVLPLPLAPVIIKCSPGPIWNDRFSTRTESPYGVTIGVCEKASTGLRLITFVVVIVRSTDIRKTVRGVLVRLQIFVVLQVFKDSKHVVNTESVSGKLRQFFV